MQCMRIEYTYFQDSRSVMRSSVIGLYFLYRISPFLKVWKNPRRGDWECPSRLTVLDNDNDNTNKNHIMKPYTSHKDKDMLHCLSSTERVAWFNLSHGLSRWVFKKKHWFKPVTVFSSSTLEPKT